MHRPPPIAPLPPAPRRCFLLERFLHDVLFESRSPQLIASFAGVQRTPNNGGATATASPPEKRASKKRGPALASHAPSSSLLSAPSSTLLSAAAATDAAPASAPLASSMEDRGSGGASAPSLSADPAEGDSESGMESGRDTLGDLNDGIGQA